MLSFILVSFVNRLVGLVRPDGILKGLLWDCKRRWGNANCVVLFAWDYLQVIFSYFYSLVFLIKFKEWLMLVGYHSKLNMCWTSELDPPSTFQLLCEIESQTFTLLIILRFVHNKITNINSKYYRQTDKFLQVGSKMNVSLIGRMSVNGSQKLKLHTKVQNKCRQMQERKWELFWMWMYINCLLCKQFIIRLMKGWRFQLNLMLWLPSFVWNTQLRLWVSNIFYNVMCIINSFIECFRWIQKSGKKCEYPNQERRLFGSRRSIGGKWVFVWRLSL